jgi:hypothetical protein
MPNFKSNYEKLNATKLSKGPEIAKLEETYDYAQHIFNRITGNNINWSADDYDEQTGDLLHALDNMISAAKDII